MGCKASLAYDRTVDGSVDPGAAVAMTMADAMAAEGAYDEALWWLELAGEHGKLDPACAAKRAQWIRRVRRGTGDVEPRDHARSVRPELPSS
jgi:hypothetical protein